MSTGRLILWHGVWANQAHTLLGKLRQPVRLMFADLMIPKPVSTPKDQRCPGLGDGDATEMLVRLEAAKLAEPRWGMTVVKPWGGLCD